MDAQGRKVIVWTGTTSGLNFLAVEQVLVKSAHSHGTYGSHFHGKLATEQIEKFRRRSVESQDRTASLSSKSSTGSSSTTETPRLHLILALRDPSSDHAVDALQRFRQLADQSGSLVEGIGCDLSSFRATRNFASAVLGKNLDISTVVLGAGISCWGPPSFTEEKCEMGMTVNHLSQWLLVALLSPRIKDRVVFVGSSLYKNADLSGVMFRTKKGKSIGPIPKPISYAATKAVQALCLSEWGKFFQGSNVDVIICTPGFVPSTDLKRHSPLYVQFLMHHVVSKLWFTRTPEQGANVIAQTVVSSLYDGKTYICIDKHLKECKLDFTHVRTDNTEVHGSVIPSSTPRINSVSTDLTTVTPRIPASDSEDVVDALQQASTRERDSAAYWNWTCIIVKERELMVRENEDHGQWDDYSP
ncbi:hypothetical protein V1517DRAFT_331065 [Lipomyces orientalis]|uniref:Uncharacterized protein n=1 Tax=Lipomyces orientalis TaxID=1233043 RepID=A0ACC3TFL8_9ASCO